MPERRVALRAALVLALAAGAGCGSADASDAQSWRTVSSSRQAWDEKALQVEVEYGAGRLRVSPADRPLLYQFQMRFDDSQVTPVTEYDRASGRLRLGMESRDRRRGIQVKNVSDEARADLHLTRDVPLDLELEFGAGESDIDLGGLSLQRLRLATGASDTRVSFRSPNRIRAETVKMEAGAASFEATGLGNARAARYEFDGGVGEATLDFTGAWDRNASAKVSLGIGALKLRFPRDLGVRIVKDSFLTSFDAPGMVKRGGAYYSRNWESASNRLTVELDAAFGSISVVWIDPQEN
ncbi:MAG TPA: toast rack family protein [Longimicrobiaceae bacterium]|nr:toast rack family protein [Longimicrobiaceae bacterium]